MSKVYACHFIFSLFVLLAMTGCHESRNTTNQKLQSIVQALKANIHDQPAREVLIDYLENGTSFQKMKACYAAMELSSDARFVLNQIIMLAKSNDPYVVPMAVKALGKIDPTDGEAFATLLDSLDRDFVESRIPAFAAESLGNFANFRERSIPILEQALKSKNQFLPYRAEQALEKLRKPLTVF